MNRSPLGVGVFSLVSLSQLVDTINGLITDWHSDLNWAIDLQLAISTVLTIMCTILFH